MKTKTKNRKTYKWKKKADSSPIAKGRRVKRNGIRNPAQEESISAASGSEQHALRSTRQGSPRHQAGAEP